MTAEEVTTLINREVGADRKRTNAHGCTLERCLVTPSPAHFKCGPDASETVVVWLVLEEDFDQRNGYKIVYGEDKGMFGLAMRVADGTDWFVAWYGSFLETYDAM
ncbi:MAG: hypothetical protein ABIF82_07035 [Planctomycetota bacterium]